MCIAVNYLIKGFEMLKYLPLITLFISLTGCMTSPQVIKLQPEFTKSTAYLANDVSPFSIHVVENRASNVLGVRSAGDTSATISTAENSANDIQQMLITAFRENGYPVTDDAENQLLVSIEDMGYVLEADGLIKEVKVNVEINASVVTSTETFSKKYKVNHGKEVLKIPDDEFNIEFVNKVFTVVIQRVLDDFELLDYLVNS